MYIDGSDIACVNFISIIKCSLITYIKIDCIIFMVRKSQKNCKRKTQVTNHNFILKLYIGTLELFV